MHLEVGGIALPIAQLGPDFLIMEHATEYSATQAEIVLQVDSTERRWPVSLPKGLAATGQRTLIVNQS